MILFRKYARFPVVFPFVMAVVSLSLLALTASYPERSGIFPKFILYILIATSSAQLIIELVKARKAVGDVGTPPKERIRRENLKLWSTIAGLIVYVWLIYFIGFGLSTLLFVAALSRVLGVKKWMNSILLAAATFAFIYLIFSSIFSIPLPKGSLIELLFS